MLLLHPEWLAMPIGKEYNASLSEACWSELDVEHDAERNGTNHGR
jgi:hypothetical protein